MLYLFRLLLLLINIDQETVLNWFGLDSPNDLSILNDNVNLSNQAITSSTSVSFETLHLIVQGLWQHVQEGLTLADIETILFFILFVRFIVLAIRYNLKTSLYITCIGLFAGGFVSPGSANYVNTCEKITIATTGNSVNIGDLTLQRLQPGCCSDSHGGLS